MQSDPVFDLHRGGKLEVASTVPLNTREDISLAYTPGVAEVCRAIAADESLVHEYTWVSHTVAVVTDGSAVLGLGNIGPRAALPVMEGKAVLFKQFGGVDAVPICLDTQDVEEIIKAVTQLAPSFGGINLEDISAPRCFEIERRLDEALPIPVFHDDQHGTAIVVLAALRNAAQLLDRKLCDLRVTVSGAGAVPGRPPTPVVPARAPPPGGARGGVARRYAAIVATGRSDFPNQINNVLAFPGVFRGALDAHATRVTERMKVAAAEAIAGVVADTLSVDAIVPSALDPRVAPAVAAAVRAAAVRDGVVR